MSSNFFIKKKKSIKTNRNFHKHQSLTLHFSLQSLTLIGNKHLTHTLFIVINVVQRNFQLATMMMMMAMMTILIHDKHTHTHIRNT